MLDFSYKLSPFRAELLTLAIYKILDLVYYQKAIAHGLQTKDDRQFKLIVTDNFCRSHPADTFIYHQVQLL
ncbi:MAG: hypothetical protein LH628_16380 [Microcoleus sp. CAN_BIN18]|nr:hypothetical protein [Microcoleus sp. CAN_BIN18]